MKVGEAALVTGGAGFAGRHLVQHLVSAGRAPFAPTRSELDLIDRESVRSAMRELQPARVFHLAAIASTAGSWKEPGEVLLRNLEMTANVLESARMEAPDARVLIASSGQVYGAPAELPVEEQAPFEPLNPYAVSKAACELLAGQYVDAHGMRVVCARAFNHAGPGQSDEYLLGTLARQVATAETEGRRGVVIRAGDLDAARDFTDVRDVVGAYAAAVDLEPGPYNVCSGQAVSAGDLIELLRGFTSLEIQTELDPDRLRPVEIRELRGSAERLRAATGWEPELPLERTVEDTLEAWREQLAGAQTLPGMRASTRGRTSPR